MKTKNFLTVIALFSIISAIGQKPTFELTFTAIDNAVYVQLDSIKVINRTQEGDTMLYWPDTVLVLDYQVGISEINSNVEKFQVFQNYPNPIKDRTTISLYVPERGQVSVLITDMLGRVIIQSKRMMDKGTYSFRFSPGEGNLYFFTAQWKGNSSSIKIIQTASNSYGKCSLKYIGSEASSPQLKTTEDIQSFSFNLGDELLYIGYANSLQTGMLDIPETSATYILQFATNISCPGMPTVTYEGQVYNTIQVFSQCWLKENLNVGTMIEGIEDMTNNNIIEKYCYYDMELICNSYGGLYQWDEIMQYTNQEGIQGICPPDWHIPTDEDLKVLEGAVDSQYGIGDQIWDIDGDNGLDAGTNLKTTSGWNDGGNGTDLFGYSGMPSGFRDTNIGNFMEEGDNCFLWTSTVYSSDLSKWGFAWTHNLMKNKSGVRHHDYDKTTGFSVRCVRDY